VGSGTFFLVGGREKKREVWDFSATGRKKHDFSKVFFTFVLKAYEGIILVDKLV
jgi:hypothetical protein